MLEHFGPQAPYWKGKQPSLQKTLKTSAVHGWTHSYNLHKATTSFTLHCCHHCSSSFATSVPRHAFCWPKPEPIRNYNCKTNKWHKDCVEKSRPFSLAMLTAQFTCSRTDSGKLLRDSPGLRAEKRHNKLHRDSNISETVKERGGGPSECIPITTLVDCQAPGFPVTLRDLRVVAGTTCLQHRCRQRQKRCPVLWRLSAPHYATAFTDLSAKQFDISAQWQLFVHRTITIWRH